MLGCSNWSLILKRKEMPEQNYPQPMVPLPTPGDRLGQWQTSRECHRFLRWGHGGPLGESSVVLCLEAGNEPTAALVHHHGTAGRLQSRLRATSTPPTPGVR